MHIWYFSYFEQCVVSPGSLSVLICHTKRKVERIDEKKINFSVILSIDKSLWHENVLNVKLILQLFGLQFLPVLWQIMLAFSLNVNSFYILQPSYIYQAFCLFFFYVGDLVIHIPFKMMDLLGHLIWLTYWF